MPGLPLDNYKLIHNANSVVSASLGAPLYFFHYYYHIIMKPDLIKEVIFKLLLPSIIPSRFCFRISFTGTEHKSEKLGTSFLKIKFCVLSVENPRVSKTKIEFYTNWKFCSK
jgi:hypothetical protein